MDYLPKGANFIRAKFLWEIGLHIAGNPATPYYGNRDICITVGSGSGAAYKPWLRMSCGSPILAHAVARGELEAAIVNPSAMLTQAVRGKGLFTEPLPLCIVANYPSWDRFAFMVHPRAGINSLADVEKWGGSLQLNGGPGDKRRLKAIGDGAVDAVFDEGLALWLEHALAAGFKPLTLEPEVFAALGEIGWRRVVMPKGRYKGLDADYVCIDYSAWPLYARTDLPEEDAYKIVDAIAAREKHIVWEEFNAWAPYQGIGALGEETEATPRDVPLHPGSVRWFREHGFKV